ncbi:CarD family transcriptional regulator [Bradyrhizobium sp. CCBAU 53421]|uniref:CarD family transcriptional regulator n=1 Tax=Bradyrhizobium sp. CCBAU 53421 TaxID=1325120 RepID=UPI00188CC75A|nr:CarD family transcriptional regulator [Bradyrhizobium sp. CCBAU 53421]QOZ37864.1 CarD family transcriptional regulator [Bradyrhizobium sp. CCBAU 53421]
MNFDYQPSANHSGHTQSAAPAAHQADGCQSNKARFGFKTTDLIVYPAHGVGQIVAIEEQTVAGACLEFFVVYFEKSKMTLRVPTSRAAKTGMRRLSEPGTVQHVRRILGQPPHKARGNWSRIAHEYESKINSGDIVAIAEVMRDLHRRAASPDQNYAERQLYTTAVDRLSEELALVSGMTEQEAVKELESLIVIEVKRSA